MISNELIAEIRERTDIVGLIGEFVELKQRGANFTGLCPFHNEKSPSFNVRRDRQFFHCFGCKESGDAFAFLMRIEGITFRQAALALAERAGVEIPETQEREDADTRRERVLRERLYAVSEAATAFYVQQLQQQPADGPGRRELAARGVTPETAEQFRLGYAPAAWDALARFLEQRGHSLTDAATLGLIAARKNGRGYYDRFRHRLMFPIAELHGRVVAFSGRLLPPLPNAPIPAGSASAAPEPKYVNSPEHPVYKKGALLFGLHQARVEIRRNGWAVLCEGNFDLVALHQAGIRNAVAPLGTAFTEAQARLLRRFAQRATLMFDADNAGRKAVEAAFPLLRQADLTGRVATLPAGADPDSYVREHGPEALQQVIDKASGLVEFLIDTAADRAGAGAAERANEIARLAPTLVAVDNPVERELYVQRIAQRFGIADQRIVREQLRQGVSGASKPSKPSAPTPSRTVAPPKQHVKLPELELMLLGALLDKPGLFSSQYAENVKELLTVSELRAIFSAAAVQVAEQGSLNGSPLFAQLEQLEGHPAHDWLKERLSREEYSDDAQAEHVLRKGIPLLVKQNIEGERKALLQRIQRARQRGDETEATSLTRQWDELGKHAHHLVMGVKRKNADEKHATILTGVETPAKESSQQPCERPQAGPEREHFD